MTSTLRIAIIASSRHPIKEPFAGGLEAHTWALAAGLQSRGHQVTLFAGEGTDPALRSTPLTPQTLGISDAARNDVSMPAHRWLEDHHAYLSVMVDLQHGRGDFDVVHNNCLHYLPIAMARAVSIPQVTTLHTPPTPWLESAMSLAPCPINFVAVSRHTARAWRHILDRPARVIFNGIDVRRWQPGPGGGPMVWSGRLVPEKGPDLAIAAARRAGVALQLAGPIADQDYFAQAIAPLLGRGVEYVGHLTRAELAPLIGRASACLVTPRWEEPYGLVAAEALACGTPVLGFARGGLPEIVRPGCGELVPSDDVAALAVAIDRRTDFDRAVARRQAERNCSLSRMVDEYERLYAELSGRVAA